MFWRIQLWNCIDGNGGLLESNDNWRDDPDQAARIIGANLAPSNPLESAISMSLAPGNYTAIVRERTTESVLVSSKFTPCRSRRGLT